MAYKKIVNNSGVDFNDVTVIPRDGDDPANSGTAVNVGPIANGEYKEVTYGNDANPYLNGFTLTADGGGYATTITEIVTERGSHFDDVLNTNSTVTITSFGTANCVGSN